MVVVCWFVAYWLRFNLYFYEFYLPSALHGCCWRSASTRRCTGFAGFTAASGATRHLMDMRRIVVAVGLAALLVAVAIYMLSVP